MAFKANILLIFSLVLMIISSEVIARKVVETNQVQNTFELDNPTLQKKGGGSLFPNIACLGCSCPKKDNNNNNNNNNNDDDDDDDSFIGNVCKAMCC
uniref:HT-protein n=1 Tax=Solanum peruvianum TaxID=4082 RepID=Q8LP79_SOLPE|nr:HT-protein [Solanum peruvianum]